jgi:hypothetical protein
MKGFEVFSTTGNLSTGMAEAANGAYRRSIRLMDGPVKKKKLVIRARASGCLNKPFSDLDLSGAVRKALKH